MDAQGWDGDAPDEWWDGEETEPSARREVCVSVTSTNLVRPPLSVDLAALLNVRRMAFEDESQ
jgi:hypothetical protein